MSALLSELVERGLDFSTPRLYILDGGKALHAAGTATSVQFSGYLDGTGVSLSLPEAIARGRCRGDGPRDATGRKVEVRNGDLGKKAGARYRSIVCAVLTN